MLGNSIQTSSCKYFHSDKGIFHYIGILSYKTMMYALEVGLVCGCSIYCGSTAWSWNSKLLQLLHQKATSVSIGATLCPLFPTGPLSCSLIWMPALAASLQLLYQFPRLMLPTFMFENVFNERLVILQVWRQQQILHTIYP